MHGQIVNSHLVDSSHNFDIFPPRLVASNRNTTIILIMMVEWILKRNGNDFLNISFLFVLSVLFLLFNFLRIYSCFSLFSSYDSRYACITSIECNRFSLLTSSALWCFTKQLMWKMSQCQKNDEFHVRNVCIGQWSLVVDISGFELHHKHKQFSTVSTSYFIIIAYTTDDFMCVFVLLEVN